MTADHERALGRITLYYAQLEHLISEFIWQVLSSDFIVGQAITAPLTYTGRRQLLESLFEILALRAPKTTGVKALVAALQFADKATKKRNDVVHALMWRSPGQEQDPKRWNLPKRRKRGSIGFEVSRASVRDLEDVASSLSNAVQRLAKVKQDHFDAHFNERAFMLHLGLGTLWGHEAQTAIAFFRHEQKEAAKEAKPAHDGTS